MCRFVDETRKAIRRWKEYGYIGRTMLMMWLQGKRKRGRSKIRFRNAMREDMAVGLDETVDIPLWPPLMGEAERRRRRSMSTLAGLSRNVGLCPCQNRCLPYPMR